MGSIINRIKLSVENKLNRLKVFNYNTLTRYNQKRKFFDSLKNDSPQETFKTIYSDSERSIQVLQKDKELKQIICTCYFTQKVDPQFGIVRNEPDINYISPWYDSIVNLKINGIIIHDGLNENFISKYQNEYVQFRKYESGLYSIFEERWMAYYLFLKETNIDWAFFTDINDVYIKSNPFEFARDENKLYMGRDNANKIRHSKWLIDEAVRFENDSNYKIPSSYYFQTAYNAGVVGGNKKILLFFISRIIDFVIKTDTSEHKDMTLVNLVIHNHFFPKLYFAENEQKLVDSFNDKISQHQNLMTGFPLNSEFKKMEIDSNAIFIHK